MLRWALQGALGSIFTLHKQVNLIGVDCVTAEEFYMKYGAEGLLSSLRLFR